MNALNKKEVLKYYFLSMLFLLLVGCSSAVKKEVAPEKTVIKKIETVVVEPEVEIVQKQGVIILMSSSAGAYQEIADRLSSHFGEDATQIVMSSRSAENKSILKDINQSDRAQVVALGLRAARLVKGIDKQVVFSQIVNYNDYGLLSDNMKGVCALPSPEKLFKDWRAISPGLNKVSIVAGKRLNQFINRAKKAASAEGIELIIEQVRTDKEFIYKSKNMKLDIQGQWIIPDNRVLSSKALKEVMAYASRRGREIVVFSPKLLSFGGLFYVAPDNNAIAEGIIDRLEQSLNEVVIPGEDIYPVMEHKMGINQKIAKQLNLNIPGNYREYIHGE